MTTGPLAATQNRAELLLSDPQTNRSWYLDNSTVSHLSIDVASVWQDYTGDGVRIGVLDSQIDLSHRDLRNAYDTTLDYNFSLGTDTIVLRSSDLTDTHGTMVAGVIAAEGGNGAGSVGIAPGATLVGLGIDYSSSSVLSQVIAGLRAAAELDVVNNSWSFTRNFADNFARAENASMAAALAFVAETGRDGLGTSMVFSAGNAGSNGSSNYHNFQNSPYTIAVGAVESDGDPWSSTSLGANVLISAAGSGVYTTTVGGRYTPASGTSFSAPAVSAVIGLMLEANPELGYRDVQQILALSATREGLTDNPLHGDGWRTNGVDTFNGGGMHYSDAFGYGFVNAHNAVRIAETWISQQTASNRDTVVVQETIGQTMTAGVNDHISFDIDVVSAIQVEHVRISLDLRWQNTGDLDIYLTSPDGTSVRLVYDLPNSSTLGGVRSFTFTSVGTMGEMGAGEWQVDIYNRNPNALGSNGAPMTGLMQGVTLTIHGSNDDLQDDVYVYTNEFGSLYAGTDLNSRRLLRDTDGGTDTINAAAVTSDTRIDLSGAAPSRIAGVTLDVQRPDVIENVFTGDGDDDLTGNAADNWFIGGRGDDTLHYSSGNDTLDGGTGTDTLSFDGVFASVHGLITNAGSFMLGLLDAGMSLVSGIEFFSFSDVTYSWSQLAGVIPPSPRVDTPVDETPDEEVPDTGGSNGEPPTDEPEVGPIFDAVFTGSESAERMLGSLGMDDMIGAGGDDNLLGMAGADRIDGGRGNDRLNGGDGNDSLLGGIGADTIVAGTGNDTLTSGSGADVLFGNTGADTFVFNLNDHRDMDVIRDFSVAEGDRILLNGLSATSGADLELVTRGSFAYLELDIGGETIRIARIMGDGIDQLTSAQLSPDSLLFA